jgi:hypothetical protein
VHDEVAVVHEHPLELVEALDAPGLGSTGVGHRELDLVDDGLDQPELPALVITNASVMARTSPTSSTTVSAPPFRSAALAACRPRRPVR